ncbi:MAG: efflux RND transporter periplasmic adaptor subunit [Alphaproteobacteria bacterium]|nr:efflux RND transporter periplasmic adaptor subunit [Alphaproteobacteria bacterium]
MSVVRTSRGILPSGSLALLALLASACGEPKKAPPSTREVGYVTLATEPVTLTADLAGRTNPYEVAEIRPQIGGIIQKRLFVEGGKVKAGQPLYQIDPSTYRAARDQAAAQLASAEATAAAAQSKAERYATLTGTEAVSRQDADDVAASARQASAAVQQAKAALQSAEINLGYTRILSPINGTIGRSSVTQGALVIANQTTALTTVWRLDPIYVDINESGARLSKLRQAMSAGDVTPAGADITLTLDDGSAYKYPGHVEFSETAVDESTGTVTIRASVPNPDGLLLPGMFVRVQMQQGVVPDGILAPQQGISRDPTGRATALVVGAGDKVEPREVEADRAIGDKWLITGGLKAGDRLIVEGTDKVRPGQLVKPVAVSLAKAK